MGDETKAAEQATDTSATEATAPTPMDTSEETPATTAAATTEPAPAPTEPAATTTPTTAADTAGAATVETTDDTQPKAAADASAAAATSNADAKPKPASAAAAPAAAAPASTSSSKPLPTSALPAATVAAPPPPAAKPAAPAITSKLPAPLSSLYLFSASIAAPAEQSERLSRLDRQVTDNPADVDSWAQLFVEAQKLGIDEARSVYKRFFTRFPYSGRHWELYIRHEMRNGNFEAVEQVFQDCFIKLNLLSIELWQCYLNYVSERTKGDRQQLREAYEFALDRMGLDPNCTAIWQEYIQFLKSEPVDGEYHRGQRLMAVRRAYKRSVEHPKLRIEQLWRDYTEYEQSVNKVIAKKILDETSRKYMSVRRVSREMASVTKGLNRQLLPSPPGSPSESHMQRRCWKAFLTWEMGNPTGTEDHALHVRRVLFAYQQYCHCFSMHPDVWYEAVTYMQNESEKAKLAGDANSCQVWQQEALTILARAAEYLPTSLLIGFAFADMLEALQQVAEAKKRYETLVQRDDVDATLVYIQYMKFARRTGDIKAVREVFKKVRKDDRCGYQAYVASALLERGSGERGATVCGKIFELGLKKFADQEGFVGAYLTWLMHSSENNNIRATFERILQTVSPDKAKDVWLKFFAFESMFGDLNSVDNVSSRRAAAYPKLYEGAPCRQLVDRYRYMDLWPCSDTQMESFGYINHDRKQTVEVEAAPAVVSNVPAIARMAPLIFEAATKPGIVCPPAVQQLLRCLPPPETFKGPMVNVDLLLKELGERELPPPPSAPGADQRGIKRGPEDDAEVNAEASVDIFRQRQKQKAKTLPT
eukprot:m.309155 g.309155  ORF g.309155 m.309155 type:complete len:820 (+) comp19636_c0_seq5:265-2724(+)